jgi:hypothetical protein
VTKMTPSRLTTAALAVAALVLAGCSQASPHTSAGSPAAASSAPHSAVPSPSSTGPLTVSQARHVYVSLVDPSNRADAQVGNDAQDAAPIGQYRRDVRALIASLELLNRKLAAVRWPVRVQPYIDAMGSTDVAAQIKCFQRLQGASTYSQANTIFDTNSWCLASQQDANASEIRTLLHLPALNG